MTAITINSATATILEGNYIGACTKSCAIIDAPTKERVVVVLDGVEYERTVYERFVWRNQGDNTLIARFVWINGTFYAIDEQANEAVADTDELEAIVATQTGFVESAANNLVHKQRIYDLTHDDDDWQAILIAHESLDARTDRLAKRLHDLRVATGKALDDGKLEREICRSVAEGTRDLFVKRMWHEIKGELTKEER